MLPPQPHVRDHSSCLHAPSVVSLLVLPLPSLQPHLLCPRTFLWPPQHQKSLQVKGSKKNLQLVKGLRRGVVVVIRWDGQGQLVLLPLALLRVVEVCLYSDTEAGGEQLKQTIASSLSCLQEIKVHHILQKGTGFL